MRLFAATRATVLLAVSLVLAEPAQAGDRALFQPIGFSSDGRYFAFEEFGVQDGSGFPYSNVFVLDLPADSWVPGTPLRLTRQDETTPIADLRAEAWQEAASVIEQFGIDQPAAIIALNGDGEPDAAAYSLRFGAPGYGLDPVRDEHLLELEVFDLPPGIDCAIVENQTKGFALMLDGMEVSRDSGTLPRSRGCAMDYRVYAVVTPADFSVVPSSGVAIIASYPFGFEGPDRRFLAVPLPQ